MRTVYWKHLVEPSDFPFSLSLSLSSCSPLQSLLLRIIFLSLAGPRSPPPHLREPSPPRRLAPSSFPPPAEGLLTPSSSNPRDSFRYGRSNTPPPRYPPRDQPLHPSTDSLPLRRTRDIDVQDTGYDQTKRRRLNEDLGPPRRFPPDLPPVAASLPAKPVPASFPAEGSPVDASRTYLPVMTSTDPHTDLRRSSLFAVVVRV